MMRARLRYLAILCGAMGVVIPFIGAMFAPQSFLYWLPIVVVSGAAGYLSVALMCITRREDLKRAGFRW